ncbi:hypothetical protein LNV23_18895 [Paucibacter sp. DJ1R-11]|uniref:hypothetical protein n=1 Tax=Paucibacter sp. DJ1R-11 TaxID=2893556 RepID=UPI0021E418DA|nr:hypothetical protein [Paucibacter sp. DJ1R-11]MCV2365521.1 hypothetical protein [Paucibacter sp. DJ1R-11]
MTIARFEKTVRAAYTGRAMNLLAGTIVGQLVDTSLYTPDFANHEFLSSIPAGARLGAPFVLSGKSLSAANVFDAADVVAHDFGAPLGASGEAIVLLESTGTDATSPLILWIDQDANGAISAPIGSPGLSVTWSDGANKIMRV